MKRASLDRIRTGEWRSDFFVNLVGDGFDVLASAVDRVARTGAEGHDAKGGCGCDSTDHVRLLVTVVSS